MANSFLCGLSDPNPSQVLGETPQGVVAPRGIPDCFFHSSKESLAAFHKPMFSFWVNTLGCARPPLTKRQILCSHCLSPLFLSHSRAQAGSHFCDLQKNVPPRKDDPLLAEIGWQRTKVAQTKQKSRTKPYSSLLYLTLSSHLILTTLELCESLWNTKSYVGFSVERLFLGCSESSPMPQIIPSSQEDVHFKWHQPRGFLHGQTPQFRIHPAKVQLKLMALAPFSSLHS